MSRVDEINKLLDKGKSEAVTFPEMGTLAKDLWNVVNKYKPGQEEKQVGMIIISMLKNMAKGADISKNLEEIKTYVPLRDK